jgi:N-acetylneuraminic acid mutarotase
MEQQSKIWPSPRFEHASLMLKYHLLIFAGKSELNKICEDMLVYNIKEGIWQKICLLHRPSGRQDCSMVQVENKIFLFGGRNAINNEFFNDLWEFQIDKLDIINNNENITSVQSKQIETSGQVLDFF